VTHIDPATKKTKKNEKGKRKGRENGISFDQINICSFYFAIAPLATLLIISKLFVFWPILAAALIVFSLVVGIVMLETRRWQYMNQHIKGVHTIIKASDHTRMFFAYLSLNFF
jgi:MFS superfamily sulfate permease-like transporter